MDGHNARVRARVIDAWGELLAEQGYDNATMSEAATRAGLARSSVYRHFPDKEELFFAYLEDYVAAFVEALRLEIESDQPATDRLRRVVQAELRQLASAPAISMSDVPESLSRESRPRLELCFQPLRDLVREILDQGQAEGTMSAINADQAVDMVFACIESTRTQLARQFVEPDVIADDIADFVLRGLGASTGAPARKAAGRAAPRRR